MSRARRIGPRAGSIALFLLGLTLAACRAEPERAPLRGAGWNLVVVLVDTLRADRLSLYGYGRETSPALDRFARERAVVFRRAWANAGCTFPSVNSLLTGRWPRRFLERVGEHGMKIPADVPTLAERLRVRGYATAAVSSSVVVRRSPSAINPLGGYDAGFERFDESCLERPAGCVNQRAFEILERLPEPFFLYLHYLEPHQPYRPPDRHVRRFARPGDAPAAAGKEWVARGEPRTVYRRLYEHDPEARFDDADLAYLSDLYDEEILHFDRRLERLLNRFARGGRSERTLFVRVADHGEALGEHAAWGHCRDLALPAVMATPFVVAAPGLAPGERATPVSNLDLVPTVLDLLEVPHAPAELDGRSLRAVLERGDGAAERRLLFAEQGTARAVGDGRRMLVSDLATGESRSFELEGGTAVAGGDDALGRALLAWVREQQRGASSAETVAEADALEARLRALGYL